MIDRQININQAYSGLKEVFAFPKKYRTKKKKLPSGETKSRQTREKFDISKRYWHFSPWHGLNTFFGSASYIQGKENNVLEEISNDLRDLRSMLPREYAQNPQNADIMEKLLKSQSKIGTLLSGPTGYQAHTLAFLRQIAPLVEKKINEGGFTKEMAIEEVLAENSSAITAFIDQELVPKATALFIKAITPFTKTVNAFRSTLQNTQGLPPEAVQVLDTIKNDANQILTNLTDITRLTDDFIDTYYNPLVLAKALVAKNKI